MPPEVLEVAPTFAESLHEVMAKAEGEGYLGPPYLQFFTNIIVGLASLPPPEEAKVIRSTSAPLVTISSPIPPGETQNYFSFHYQHKGSTEVRLIVTPPLGETSGREAEYPSDQYSLLLVTQDHEIQDIQMTYVQGQSKTSIIYNKEEWTITNQVRFINTREQILESLAFLSDLVRPTVLPAIFERPPNISESLFGSLFRASVQGEEQDMLSREESEKLFILLLTVYSLPTPSWEEEDHMIFSILANPKKGVKYPGVYEVIRIKEVGETRLILIPHEQDKPATFREEQIEICLATDKSLNILKIRLRYSSYVGHIILEYSDQTWKSRSDIIPWKTVRRTFLLNLEQIVLYLHETLPS